jgi:hypothetical protein
VKRTGTEHVPIAVITPNGSKNSLSKNNLLLNDQSQNSNNTVTGGTVINMEHIEDDDDNGK